MIDIIQLLGMSAPREALLSSMTTPSAGIVKTTTNQRVIVAPYRDDPTVYELLVKTRLVLSGRNPDNFVIGQAAWGERLEGSPLIQHKGKEYLQCIVLEEGDVSYTLFGKPVDRAVIEGDSRTNQRLPVGLEVSVRTYKMESITALQLL
jgi:hypothetical protein